MCGRALGEIDCEVLRAPQALGEIDCEVLPQGGGISRAAFAQEVVAGPARRQRNVVRLLSSTDEIDKRTMHVGAARFGW